MRKIPIFLILLIFLDIFLCKNLASFTTTINTIPSDSERKLKDAISKLNKNGGIIYIDNPIINISQSPIKILPGSIEGGNIGKQQSNGSYQFLIL